MSAVPFVVEERMADVFHVYADLVGTSGFQYAFHQCDVAQSFQNLIVCYGMFALCRVGQNRHLHPVLRVSSDVAGDGSFVFVDDSPYQRVVFTFGGLVVELQAQAGFGVGCLGYDQQSGGIFVNAVYQSHLRIVRIVGGYVAQVPGDGIDQCPVVITASRMDYQSGGLVDNHQVFVFVYDIQRNVFGNDIVFVTGTVHHDRQYILRLYFVAAFYRFPVGHDKSCIRSLLDTVSRSVYNAFEQVFVNTDRRLSFVYHDAEMFVQGRRIVQGLNIFQGIVFQFFDVIFCHTVFRG